MPHIDTDHGDLTTRETRKSSVQQETPQTEMETDSEPITISSDRLSIFKSSLQKVFRDQRSQSLALDKVTEYVNKDMDSKFTTGEIKSAVEIMTEENQIMEADGIIFLI